MTAKITIDIIKDLIRKIVIEMKTSKKRFNSWEAVQKYIDKRPDGNAEEWKEYVGIEWLDLINIINTEIYERQITNPLNDTYLTKDNIFRIFKKMVLENDSNVIMELLDGKLETLTERLNKLIK